LLSLNILVRIFPKSRSLLFGESSADYRVKSSEGIFWGDLYTVGKEDNPNPF
jgi:hypothetical protein